MNLTIIEGDNWFSNWLNKSPTDEEIEKDLSDQLGFKVTIWNNGYRYRDTGDYAGRWFKVD